MVNVTAKKIREHGVDRAAASRVYTGYLISYPIIGRGIVIFRDPHGHRMITTPVKRVLGEPDGKMLYVETENSVYRLEFHGEPLFPIRSLVEGVETSDSAGPEPGDSIVEPHGPQS
ncbi:MAG TPA: hypothetical protein PLF40_30630 [Kofleriaceae bacterium]|nr:hypothetical protein [Kofleriaceae bacterium]